jgi:hypothetical protein
MMDYKGENVQIVWNRPIQIGLFKWVEETHISIERKPIYLEEGSSSTLFPCENWVSFWKELFKVLKGEKGTFCSK